LVVGCCVAALALIAGATASAQLRPDQELLVEHLLSGMEPAMRPSFRADFEKLAAAMSSEEVRAVLASAGIDPNSPPPPKDESDAVVATADVAEYHRKQYEPVYRASWNAQKAFDDLVEAQLEAKCPDRHRYAIVMGAARYEVPQFSLVPLASANADNDLKILAGIAPQDGRYDFDFSGVKTSFDPAAVTAVIAQACEAWTALAAEFHARAKPLQDAGNGQAVGDLERTAHAKFYPLAEKLETELKAAGPSSNEPFFLALANGTPVR